jgi:thiamine biosynthesis lipoprotein ApbE
MSPRVPGSNSFRVLLAGLFVLIGVVALAWAAVPEAPAPKSAQTEFAFHHDHVIGTSLDLCLIAPDEATAERAELAVLDEIERLRLIFSTYDPASEISKLNKTREPVVVSSEMAEVLRAYEVWQRVSGGAFNGQVGELVRVWREAEKNNKDPSAATLERIAGELRKPGWKLDPVTNTATRLTDQPLNLNAIGKGYIIRKAAEAARKTAPEVRGLLINLGGDILALGELPGSTGWAVGIQDPFRHYDNEAPIAGLRLSNLAIATSGGYERFYTVGGKRYSHIFDPRTGRPAEGVASATVIAPDNVTANALATTLCVLKPEEGLKLVASTPGVECLLIATDGKQFRSAGLKLFDVARANVFTPVAAQDKKDEKKDEKKGSPWQEGYQVTVAVELPKIDAKRYRKPYAAIWIEDDKGKAVRTLSVWGNAPKYLKDLNDWWKIGQQDADLVKAVTRATRGPGKYELVWDGKDDKGNALQQGTYTVRVEVHREYGAHLRQSGKIECADKAATTKMDKNDETAETVVEFKEAKKK